MINGELIVDNFAGGGGASTGIEMATGYSVDIAINHDPEAIRMHKANHPNTMHYCEDVWQVDPVAACKGHPVGLAWFSPDCKHFSKAKGGKPKDKFIRGLAWVACRWAGLVRPRVIMLENVEEFKTWGPLNRGHHPIKSKQGKTFEKFVQQLTDLGYDVQFRELVAADYGAPTTRKRWYAIFRRDGKDIVWPDQTNFKDSEPKWKQCGEYIDWSDLGKSIFDRPKPLADATQKRIANGIRKYILESEPYIVQDKRAAAFIIQYHGEQKAGDARGQLLSEPIKTIDTSNRYGLVTAFITKFYKSGIGQGCDEPLHTITTSPGHFGLVSAFLIKYYGTGGGQELKMPLATITTKDRFGLVNVILDIDGEAYIIKDIFLRMLKPEELKRMQGFPDDYIINRDIDWKPYPIKEQVARIGNSVVPIMAEALVRSNCSDLIVGRRAKNLVLDCSENQLKFA